MNICQACLINACQRSSGNPAAAAIKKRHGTGCAIAPGKASALRTSSCASRSKPHIDECSCSCSTNGVPDEADPAGNRIRFCRRGGKRGSRRKPGPSIRRFQADAGGIAGGGSRRRFMALPRAVLHPPATGDGGPAGNRHINGTAIVRRTKFSPAVDTGFIHRRLDLSLPCRTRQLPASPDLPAGLGTDGPATPGLAMKRCHID